MPKTFTEEERQQRREADRARARQAVEALACSEGWRRWLSLRHRFHRYSLSNQLLIAAAMPAATRVAGFRAWLKLGYCVRKGETAVIRIWIPMPPTKAQIAAWESAGAKAEDRPRVRFRLGPVWDRSQVQGAAAARRAGAAGSADRRAGGRQPRVGVPAPHQAGR